MINAGHLIMNDFVLDWTTLKSKNANSDHTGNYADYDLCEPYVCCSWLELHNDVGYGVSTVHPYLNLQVLYWDHDAVLIATDSQDRFYEVARTASPIRIDGTKLHGVVSRQVADELLTTQKIDGPLNALFENLVYNGCFPPLLIWKWLD